MITTRITVDAEALGQEFKRLPPKVRDRVALRACRKEMGKVLARVQAAYSPFYSMLPRMHLKYGFFIKQKRYAGTTWTAVGVREGQNPKGQATNRWAYTDQLPGWRFGFIERDRRIRGGPGAGRGGKRLREGAIPLYTVPGKRYLDKAQAAANLQIPEALRRELAKAVKRA